MRPYIVSHMMESVDGRIDCAMTEKIDSSDSYYEALDSLGCPTQLMGKVTLQMHYVGYRPFICKDQAPIGRKAAHKAVSAEGYTVAMDTRGTLDWRGGECDGRPLLVITSEDCPKEYLDAMAAKGISWIAAGSGRIDLKAAMEVLGSEFGVKRVAIVGGGHINGAFLQAGLIDEVSVMIGPGIDGRKGMTAVYDGIEDRDFGPVLLDLRSIERVGSGTVWLRYAVK
jgi:2,5-diamino-6-(ribosylamino)-4(3H)-pyrimidinone 5'-phosphate reductase